MGFPNSKAFVLPNGRVSACFQCVLISPNYERRRQFRTEWRSEQNVLLYFVRELWTTENFISLCTFKPYCVNVRTISPRARSPRRLVPTRQPCQDLPEKSEEVSTKISIYSQMTEQTGLVSKLTDSITACLINIPSENYQKLKQPIQRPVSKFWQK